MCAYRKRNLDKSIVCGISGSSPEFNTTCENMVTAISDPNTKQQFARMKAIYDFASQSIHKENKTKQETIQLLMERGLNQNAALSVISNLEEYRDLKKDICLNKIAMCILLCLFIGVMVFLAAEGYHIVVLIFSIFLSRLLVKKFILK